jgi:hypothetical protein
MVIFILSEPRRFLSVNTYYIKETRPVSTITGYYKRKFKENSTCMSLKHQYTLEENLLKERENVYVYFLSLQAIFGHSVILG